MKGSALFGICVGGFFLASPSTGSESAGLCSLSATWGELMWLWVKTEFSCLFWDGKNSIHDASAAKENNAKPASWDASSCSEGGVWPDKNLDMVGCIWKRQPFNLHFSFVLVVVEFKLCFLLVCGVDIKLRMLWYNRVVFRHGLRSLCLFLGVLLWFRKNKSAVR